MAAPLASEAAGIDRALDACVGAVVDQYLPNRAVTVRKLGAAPGPLDVLARHDSYMIVIDARSKSTGEQLAQARCVASRRGDVIVLDNAVTPENVAKADLTATLVR
jgi:predicted O-methyltransferase YrrM